MQLKAKNGQTPLKMKILPPDQLEEVSNSVITIFSSSSDNEYAIIHIFYRFQWYQQGGTWF